MKHLQILLYVLLMPALLLYGGCASSPDVVTGSTAPKTLPTLIDSKLPALPPGTRLVNGIAVIVNNDIITFQEVLRAARPVISDAQKKGMLDDKTIHDLRITVMERMIERLLTEQKVKELGIKIADDEIRQSIEDVKKQNNNMTQSQLEEALKAQGYTISQYEAQIREQLERVRLLSIEVRSKVQVSDKEAEAYYNANPEKYAEEEFFKARHIFIKVDEKSEPDQIKQAMSKALNLLYEARQGKDFAELAKKYSDDPAAQKDGGDLGTFKKGDMLAELEKAIIPLKPGEIGELVITSSGLHIIKLEERSSGKLKPFETVKADIREQLYRKKQEERFTSWMKDLRAKASIVIKDSSGII